jgi:hypothetical protein
MKKSDIVLGLIGIAAGTGLYLYQTNINSTQNEIISFSIESANAVINQTSGELDVVLPTGTSLTHLAPIFTTTKGTTLTVNKVQQYSGLSYQNFESDVPYKALGGNGTFKDYFVHVTTGSQPTHYTSYFNSFSVYNGVNGGLSDGIISESNISITVPSTTDLSNLVSYYNYIGYDIKVNGIKQVNNTTINNFTLPVTYTLYGKNGTPNPYTVTISHALGTADNISRFSLLTGYGEYPCQIIESAIHCGVPSQVVTQHLIANWSSDGSKVEVESNVQTAGLTVNNFSSPIVYKVTSGDGLTTKDYTVTTDNNYISLNAKNISDTLFSNTSYDVEFNITNHTGVITTALFPTLSVESPIAWTLTSNTCNGVSLNNNESCIISGTLELPNAYDEGYVNLTITDGSHTLAQFAQTVTGIPTLNSLESSVNAESYAAYRFKNSGAHRLFATATVNNQSICFDTNHIGTIESYSDKWSTCAVEMTKGNDTLYIPAYPGVGGKVLLSVDNKIPDGASPSVTATIPADTYYTRWQQVEYGGGLTATSLPALFNLNPTAVDFVSLPTTISTVISGVVGPWDNNSYAQQGILFASYIKTTQIYSAMESGLANIPNSPTPSWNGLTQDTASGLNVLRILSPSSIFPFMSESTSQFYFNGSSYTSYINDLWEYYTESEIGHPEYGNHFLYVDDSPVASLVTPGSTCILKCQVTTSDNLMHCAYSSGSCPVNSSTGTLDGEYVIGAESAPAGFTKFTASDFVGAAGSNTMTTFGLNGTYRSITGENIVSGQSVGFLPYCSDTNFVFGNPQFSANMEKYYEPQYTCLPNYSSYTTSIIDQYSAQAQLYFFYYNYGYSDTLNQSGAVYSLNNALYPFTINVNYQ